MRMTAYLAAIATSVLIFSAHTAKAGALSPAELALEDSPTVLKQLSIDVAEVEKLQDQIAEEAVPSEPESYIIKEGDSLSKIAKEFDTTWVKLYFKNENISHPDQLEVGINIIIPQSDEELKERDLPQPEVVEPVRAVSTRASSQQSTSSSVRNTSSPRGSSSGNLYGYGYCTWYVKNQRPDLPNNLGNANTWYSRAAAQGMAVGSTPRVGAVATTTSGALGHVAYVTAVNGDGTVTVSEMNWKAWNVRSSRVAPASSFMYIY